jgi:drug/metabolite transporter (DMT)-like permease
VWPTLLLYEPVRGLEIPSKIGPPIAGVSKSGLIRRLQPILGVLPAATAVAAVLRAGEHPSAGFWLASAAGLLAVLAFAAAQGAGLPTVGDLQILVAVALGATGYAEGRGART